MIWFFIAGWIAGAVFVVMYAHWWIKKHAKVIHANEEEDEAHE